MTNEVQKRSPDTSHLTPTLAGGNLAAVVVWLRLGTKMTWFLEEKGCGRG